MFKFVSFRSNLDISYMIPIIYNSASNNKCLQLPRENKCTLYGKRLLIEKASRRVFEDEFFFEF